jgi:hypothetical protein
VGVFSGIDERFNDSNFSLFLCLCWFHSFSYCQCHSRWISLSWRWKCHRRCRCTLGIVKSSKMRTESWLWEAKFHLTALTKIGNTQSSLAVQNNWTTSGFTSSILREPKQTSDLSENFKSAQEPKMKSIEQLKIIEQNITWSITLRSKELARSRNDYPHSVTSRVEANHPCWSRKHEVWKRRKAKTRHPCKQRLWSH